LPLDLNVGFFLRDHASPAPRQRHRTAAAPPLATATAGRTFRSLRNLRPLLRNNFPVADPACCAVELEHEPCSATPTLADELAELPYLHLLDTAGRVVDLHQRLAQRHAPAPRVLLDEIVVIAWDALVNRDSLGTLAARVVHIQVSPATSLVAVPVLVPHNALVRGLEVRIDVTGCVAPSQHDAQLARMQLGGEVDILVVLFLHDARALLGCSELSAVAHDLVLAERNFDLVVSPSIGHGLRHIRPFPP